MGLLDRFASSETDADPGMASRLDKAAKLSVEHVDIPSEFRPTDLEAWLFAPSGTRVGVLGDPNASQQPDMVPELVDLVKDRFERLETALDLMESNIKLTQEQTAKLAAESVSVVGGGAVAVASGTTDVIHTVGDDGEVTSKPVAGAPPPPGVMAAQGGLPGGPGLLDLYEAQSLAVNPFLRLGEADAILQGGPGIDPTKIVALLLDHLNGSDALRFLQAAAASGVITTAEAKTLSSIASLAEPGEASEGAPALDNRTLLTFAALIEAWRAQETS
ncbi:MAG: hypothetical protein QGI41_04965 [Acidimicrobiales bacterium]|nr:hypothetical protein [Acidimicrobiales bacterium]MDP7091225.1 hypothetical protein [Candidatus Thalassarchaeaceae archaeon]